MPVASCPSLRRAGALAFLLALLAAPLAPPAFAQSAPECTAETYQPQLLFPGVNGADLRDSLAQHYRPDPANMPSSYASARDQMYASFENDDGVVTGLYTGFQISGVPQTPDENPRSDAFDKGVSTEHVWPRSKGIEDDEPGAFSNLNNLYPTRAPVNSDRLNFPYREIPDDFTDVWYIDDFQTTTPPTENRDGYSELFEGQSFEVREVREGDPARTVFYMFTVYPDLTSGFQDFFDLQKSDLRAWDDQDPTEQADYDRTCAVALLQDGKVNPFVIDSTLVERAYFGGTSGLSSVQFAEAGRTVGEAAAGSVTFEVFVHNPDDAITVEVAFDENGSTAAEGSDLSFSPQTLTFPAGSGAAQTVSVPVLDDDEAEGRETAAFVLQNVSSGGDALLGAPSRFSLTIEDDDQSATAIANARTAPLGTPVTVTGIVTRAMGAFTRIQDGTGGLTIRQPSGAFFDDVQSGAIAPGDRLEVTGAVSQFAGLRQFNDNDLTSYERLSRGNALPALQEVTLEEIAQNGEAYESEIVEVSGLQFIDRDAGGTFQAATTYSLSDPALSNGVVDFRVPNAEDTELDGVSIPTGTFTYRGVLSQFNNDFDADEPPNFGYQLLPVQTDTALPVELAGLTARADGQHVQLEWTTLSEQGNDGFEIQQRQGEDEAWARVDFVESQAEGGTSTEALHYRFRTGERAPGRYSFRLEQRDLDGDPSFSEPVSVEVQMNAAYHLSKPAPSPFAERATMTLRVQRAGQFTADLYDVLGRRIARLYQGRLDAGGQQKIVIRGAGLPSGVYFCRVEGEDFTATRKVVLVR